MTLTKHFTLEEGQRVSSLKRELWIVSSGSGWKPVLWVTVGKCVSICLRVMVILLTAGWKPVPQWAMSTEQSICFVTGCQPADLLISAIIEKTKKNTILQYYNFTRIRIYDTCKTFHFGGVLSLLQSHSKRIDNTVGWKPVPHWVVSDEQWAMSNEWWVITQSLKRLSLSLSLSLSLKGYR